MLCVHCLALLDRYFGKHLRNRHDAEDAAQHVLLKVLEVLPEYRPTAPFQTWLFTIARNHLIDRTRVQDRAEATDPEALRAMQETEVAIEAPALATQARMIRTLIAPLPKEQQRVLLLKYAHDLSPAQIATILGRTETSVRQLHKRARDALHEIIQAQSRG